MTSIQPAAAQCQNRPAEPAGSVCGDPTNCLVEFDGYWWWTNFSFNAGGPGTGYWLNGQQWDPRLISADSEGLHLKMQETQLPGAPKMQWSSVEAVLWAKSSEPNRPGSPPERFYPGYGRYLVAAKTANSFDDLSNNCCFGAFTYRFDADPPQKNSYHELDMVEISRWGNSADPTNAQFTLQPAYDLPNKANIHRITIEKAQNEVTLVMHWPGEGDRVTFSLFNGLYDFDSLPKSPAASWTTSAAQGPYIPSAACQTMHFNLWREPPDKVTPSGNQEVIVTRFQYEPL